MLSPFQIEANLREVMWEVGNPRKYPKMFTNRKSYLLSYSLLFYLSLIYYEKKRSRVVKNGLQ